MRFHGLDFVDDQTEAIAKIDERSVEGSTRRRVEDESHRIFLAADAERMNLQLWLAGGDGLANLQHVRAEHLVPFRREVVGVVLHEGGAALEIRGDDFHRAKERACFPIAFATEAVTIGHEALNGEARELLETVQVLKVCGEALEIAIFEERAQTEFDSRPIAQ